MKKIDIWISSSNSFLDRFNLEWAEYNRLGATSSEPLKILIEIDSESAGPKNKFGYSVAFLKKLRTLSVRTKYFGWDLKLRDWFDLKIQIEFAIPY